MLSGKVLITGGAGTLGKAIIKRATEEGWPCDITIYSTDAMKHGLIRREYPHVRSVIGDIRSWETLFNAISGHDIVIHGAAVKHIPVSEYNSIDTFDINVTGSLNVASACVQAQVKKCIGISTDKVCGAQNAYGATKYLMEKVFQEYARNQEITDFHLVRYGNVLESTGSVVEIWRNAVARGERIKITDPAMTRFWLSPDQAVDYVIEAFNCQPGTIWIPKMKSLDIGTLARYTTDVEDGDWDSIPLRPGEKIHETLLTKDELRHAIDRAVAYVLWPSTSEVEKMFWPPAPYTSDTAPELTKEELMELLGE